MVVERAADGRAWAQHMLGGWYKDASYGFAWKPKQALKWYELAAEQHFPDALYTLGILHYNGEVCMVKKSPAKAFAYFKEAADMGCPQSQTVLGRMYEHGEGVSVDLPLAVHYSTLAYSQIQCSDAGCQLSSFFRTGTGGMKQSYVLQTIILKVQNKALLRTL